jgi:hypothetical protein
MYYGSSGTLTAGPKIGVGGYNHWAQTKSPNSTAGGASNGYTKITTQFTSYTGPLTKTTTANNYHTSALYAANDGTSWWAPIGQKQLYSSAGIPAANGETLKFVELWVRTDNLPKIGKVSIFADSIQAREIYED